MAASSRRRKVERNMKNSRGSGNARAGFIGQSLQQAVALVAAVALLLAPVAWADGRTPLKPGWNMYSPQQDAEVGQQVSLDAERQLNMMNDTRVDNYLTTWATDFRHMRRATSFNIRIRA